MQCSTGCAQDRTAGRGDVAGLTNIPIWAINAYLRIPTYYYLSTVTVPKILCPLLCTTSPSLQPSFLIICGVKNCWHLEFAQQVTFYPNDRKENMSV